MPNAPIQRQKGLDAAAAASVLKKRDIDRYWAALFAPAAKRSGLVALYAFNSELAHITAVVSEPMVGQIRLQWWRDAIELAIPGTKTGNPIADALAAAIFEYEIEKESLLRMVDARLPEILGEPPPDIPALRAALWDRSGIIFGISANILGASDAATRKAAEHAGLAYGLTELLRSIPQQASRRKLLLPPSYFESRGVD
ncbi:MAG TPA: squalene/phytoene synthase family protein, partial [Hyphomicrobiales bacterium]|nr:squalene/phytoene synthase family protein [Hyphomicrobiales bacterium]